MGSQTDAISAVGVAGGLIHLSHFDAQTNSREDDDSPHYFVGSYSRVDTDSAATATSMPVFVKVWHQEDGGASPKWNCFG